MRCHGQEIPIVMQQVMAAFDAKGSDDQIGGFSDGDAKGAQTPIILGGADGGNTRSRPSYRRESQFLGGWS